MKRVMAHLFFKTFLILAVSLALDSVCYAQEATTEQKTQQTEDVADLPDVTLGKQDAPVHMIIVYSLTCGHCAQFHTKDFQKLQDHIDKGIVKCTLHDYPLDKVALQAAQIAWSKGPSKYAEIIHGLFESQKSWAFSSNAEKELIHLAKRFDINEKEAKESLSNVSLQKGILKKRLSAQQKYKVDSTPAFIINGEKVAGYMPAEKIIELIQAALEKRQSQP